MRHHMIDGVHIATARPEHTGGVYEVFDVHAVPAPGAPPHAAPWAASLCLLDGDLAVHVGGATHRIAPGGAITVPAHSTCAFEVTGSARFIAVTSGTDAGRFVADFARSVDPAAPDFAVAAAVAARHGVTLGPGPGTAHVTGPDDPAKVTAEHTGGVYEVHELDTAEETAPWTRTVFTLPDAFTTLPPGAPMPPTGRCLSITAGAGAGKRYREAVRS
ncbi:hypothetical protein GCM10023148_53650 [Actinokineospora soli]